MSRNPFRKARDEQVELPTSDAAIVTGLFDAQSLEPAPSAKPRSTKQKKKVVIKTPPRSPEEVHRRLSLGYPTSPTRGPPAKPHAEEKEDDNESFKFGGAIEQGSRLHGDQSGIPPTSIRQMSLQERDSTDQELGAMTRTDDSALTQSVPPTSAGRAPMNPFARTLATTEPGIGSREQVDTPNTRTKTAFDVDTFKNILLNGAMPPPRQINTSSEVIAHSASVTQDQSSIFKERFPSLDTSAGPSGNVRTTNAADEDSSSSDDDTTDEETTQIGGRPTKSLPHMVAFDEIGAAPASFSIEEQQPPEASREKALPLLPGEIKQSKLMPPPPPPPVSRRQGSAGTPNGRRRSSSIMSRSSAQSDASSIIPQASPAPDTSVKAPPPPPTRRSQPVRMNTSSSDLDPIASPGAEKLSSAPPAPAPRRALAKGTKSGRAADSSRSSMDASGTGPSGQEAMSTGPNAPRQDQVDLLANLAALQREVDALRAEAGNG